MAHRSQRAATTAAQSGQLPLAPNIAFTAWNSLLTGVNTQAVGELGTIADEWRCFVGRRLKEDVALLERLARSTGPEQLIHAYAEFWRKAAQDYGDEIARLTKLMTDMTSKMTIAAQSATEEASTKLIHREGA